MDKSRQSEWAEQAQLISWANSMDLEVFDYLHSSLNGERLTKGQAKKAKAAGMKAGVPDLFLPEPVMCTIVEESGYTREWHGLYIEMKTLVGRAQKVQKKFCAHLQAKGYAVVLCRTWYEGKQAIINYLDGRHINEVI